MLGVLTLLDLMKRANAAGADLVEEALVNAPELTIFPAKTIAGVAMQLLVRKGLPDVRFQNLNEGVPASKSEYETRTFQAAILDHFIQVDKRGFDGMSAEQIGRELGDHTVGVLEAAFAHVGSQFYYGTGNDAKGFPGVIAQMNADARHVIDVGGKTSVTSAWVFASGPAKVEFILGNNQTIVLPDEEGWKETEGVDAEGNRYPALAAWMTGRVGMRLANRGAAIRIKNIGTEAGKRFGADYLAQALTNMRDNRLTPTHIVMNGRTLLQWRDSRKTDQNPEPEIPKEYEGVPVVQSASIANGEAI